MDQPEILNVFFAPTPAAGGAKKTFKISGWSNSTQVYKYVCDCEAGDAPADSASSADLPSELNIKYVNKDEFKADGKVRFVMKPTGDDQRLVALLDFFKKYDRVGQMDLEGGGVLCPVL